MNKILLNIALLIVLAALIMILFPTTDQERSIKQTEVSIPETSKHVRIATNIQNENMIEVLNKYARPGDVLEIRAKNLDKLSLIKTATPLLIYGKNDDQTKSFQLAKKYGIKMIAYNLEDSKISYEDLIRKEKEAYVLAKENDLLYIFAPLAIHVEKYGAEISKNADVIAIQLRNHQLMKNFANEVKEMVADIKNANPNIEVWVQLDVNPRINKKQDERQELQSEEILKQINLIKNDVDLISIFYPPDDASVVTEVFVKLRQ